CDASRGATSSGTKFCDVSSHVRVGGGYIDTSAEGAHLVVRNCYRTIRQTGLTNRDRVLAGGRPISLDVASHDERTQAGAGACDGRQHRQAHFAVSVSLQCDVTSPSLGYSLDVPPVVADIGDCVVSDDHVPAPRARERVTAGRLHGRVLDCDVLTHDRTLALGIPHTTRIDLYSVTPGVLEMHVV